MQEDGQAHQGVYFVDAGVLEQFMVDVFVKVGVPPQDAAICGEVLIASDLRGIDSHGISRLKPIYYKRIKDGILSPTTKVEILKEGPATALVDGHNGMGHVIGRRCMELAIKKAREFGIAMTAARNSSHYGIAGYYAEMAADAGMIGITGTNARPSVAPTFGVENMLGTNPLTFAMPSDEEFPFSLDCATSTSQRGKIEVHARHNKPVPEGWVINEAGETATDPHEILQALTLGSAALTPLGGLTEETGSHKGYGYAAVVEILSAALQSGPFLKALTGIDNGQKVPHRLGHFFIAINIEAFTERDSFAKTTGDILRALRASKRAPGQEQIFTAGEKEYYTMQERRRSGIPIYDSLQSEIRSLVEELDLRQYDFPFLRD